jgi:hypothetical protein
LYLQRVAVERKREVYTCVVHGRSSIVIAPLRVWKIDELIISHMVCEGGRPCERW